MPLADSLNPFSAASSAQPAEINRPAPGEFVGKGRQEILIVTNPDPGNFWECVDGVVSAGTGPALCRVRACDRRPDLIQLKWNVIGYIEVARDVVKGGATMLIEPAQISPWRTCPPISRFPPWFSVASPFHNQGLVCPAVPCNMT